MVTDSPTVAVIIVTYDSGRVLGRCLDCLLAQTRKADLVVVVDNDSPDPSGLEQIPRSPPFRLLRLPRNEGFCTGNNIGYREVSHCTFVLFLNPDAFLDEDFLEKAVAWMHRPENRTVGCLTGTLLGYDVENDRPTGLLDSTGIFQKWYGRWYDRGRGTPASGFAASPEDVPAACGALMFCRSLALKDVSRRGGEVFDGGFFMYKEDIDLSLRLRAKGWRVVYLPILLCHHGRGWQGRTAVSYRARYLSTRNELRICFRNGLLGLPYSLAKFLYVSALEPLVHSIRQRITPTRADRGGSALHRGSRE